MTEPLSPEPARSPDLILLAVGGLGAAAVITQLALLRELLGAFAGNELVLGLALGSWLLLTGAGAWLGRFAGRSAPPERTFALGLLGVAWLPLLQLLAVRGGRDLVFPHGASVGVGATALGCTAVLLPFCLLSGTMLTLACAARARAGDPASVGRVYFADTVGSLLGGALFSFVLVSRLDHFALLAVPAFFSLVLCGALSRRFHSRSFGCRSGFTPRRAETEDGPSQSRDKPAPTRCRLFSSDHEISGLAWRLRSSGLLIAAALSAVALGTALWRGEVDARSSQWQHHGEIVWRASSPYGRLVVTREAGQLTFFENGLPVFHTDNHAATEEAAHYALAQRRGPRRVLLVSGGVAGTAREVLRHAGAEVTCLELDPGMIAAGRRLLPENLADARLHLLVADGRRFLQRTSQTFDVVILDLPAPATLQVNRFFTAEAFAAIKRVLAPGGVLSFGLGQYHNYVSTDLARLLASTHRTLGDTFAHVLMIPGGRVFFLASDAPLHLDLADRLAAAGVQARWVNRSFLQATLAPDRLADLARAVAPPAARNTDFRPALFHYHLRHWLGQFDRPFSLPGLALLAALAAYLVRLAPVPRAVFAAGFAASALELVALLAYQVLYGSLYQQVGLVITVFMTGLAAGAAWSNRRVASQRSRQAVFLLGFGLAALAAAFPALLPHLELLDRALGTDLAGQAAILLLTFLLAGLVGAQFPLAGAADPAGAVNAASRLFTADLLGAALGALLVSAWLVPLLGVSTVCFLTAGLNALAAALGWRPQRNA